MENVLEESRGSMKINKDGSLTITLTPEQVAALKDLVETKTTQSQKLPEMFSTSGGEVILGELRGFNKISSQFFEVRSGGEYDEQGIYLGTPGLGDQKWKIVLDDDGSQVLIPE